MDAFTLSDFESYPKSPWLIPATVFFCGLTKPGQTINFLIKMLSVKPENLRIS
jgi:hypothetical protein